MFFASNLEEFCVLLKTSQAPHAAEDEPLLLYRLHVPADWVRDPLAANLASLLCLGIIAARKFPQAGRCAIG